LCDESLDFLMCGEYGWNKEEFERLFIGIEESEDSLH
jgi:hypothetical protein